MFPQAVRALREVKPKAFIFENVKGLTRASFRNYFEYIRLQMIHPEIVARPEESWEGHLARLEQHETSGVKADLHYNVIVHVANAADFGVPQRRERVFFVGFRRDLGVKWRFPAATHSADALAWAQYRSGDYWERHRTPSSARAKSTRSMERAARMREQSVLQPWRTVRDAIADLPDPTLSLRSGDAVANHRFQPGARSYAGHTGSPLDEPAKTLKAGVHGVPGGENMLLMADGSVRYFTVRESARLQTFPDAFHFHGSWSETMRQLGNAVPVSLARIVATDVLQSLEAARDDRAL